VTNHDDDGEIIDPTDAQFADDSLLDGDDSADQSGVERFGDEMFGDDDIGPDVTDSDDLEDLATVDSDDSENAGLDDVDGPGDTPTDDGRDIALTDPEVATESVDDEPPDVWAGVGVYPIDPIVSLAAVADIDGDDVMAALADLGFDPADLDARDSVRLLDAVGVEARVEHGSIDLLVEHLADGGTLRVISDGTTYAIEQFDDLRDTAVLRSMATGVRYELPLEAFEDSWSNAANEMIVAADGRGGGQDTLLVAAAVGNSIEPIGLDL
jgi:hypothetical protein